MENIKTLIPIKMTEDEKNRLTNKFKNKSLSDLCPSIINEWDYELNGDLKPNMVARFSNKKVWWHCSYGHKWFAVISKRPDAGCPYCKGNIVSKGENDLESNNPIIIKEWDYEKNKDLLPSMVTKSSSKMVWWKCNLGHSWQATVNKRVNLKNNCPYCANKKIWIGYNDLSSTNPKLLKEWDYEKNKDLLPSMVTKGSSKMVWWKCNLGHSWQATILNRSNGRSCPYCSGHKVLKGYNDIGTTHAELLNEWDYSLNKKEPESFSFGSQKKYGGFVKIIINMNQQLFIK